MKPVRFTNGKWRVLEGLDHNDNLTVAVEGGERTVCECVCADSEDRANAHLIAAAPELYDALQSFLNEMPVCNCHEGFTSRGRVDPSCVRCQFLESIKEAESALAKARGEA